MLFDYLLINEKHLHITILVVCIELIKLMQY